MKEDCVCVITGGGSCIGLATAKAMGGRAPERGATRIVLAGRTEAKLAKAACELRDLGIEALPFACDLADETSTKRLADFAASAGRISSVIHAAGLSPHMGEVKSILEASAIGTINVNESFHDMLGPGACLIDLSSMSAHIAPQLAMPRGLYPLSRSDKDRFLRRMIGRVKLFPRRLGPAIAYAFSKDFVIWYARTDATSFGERGVRILSVSPGNFETPMGELEKAEGGAYIERAAIKRFGKVEEMAFLLASCADERMGYLTGVDILCDGGVVAAKKKLLSA